MTSSGVNRVMNTMTWGDLLEVTRPFGVEVRQTRDPLPDHGVGTVHGKFLYRKCNGEDFWHPLPSNFDEKNRAGPWSIEKAVVHLGLKLHQVGLAIIM